MPLALERVVALLEATAPLAFAEDWDNVGLLLEPLADRRDPARKPEIARALFTIDLTEDVASEAVALDADLVVAYHPPIFRPLTRLRRGTAGERVVQVCTRAGIAVYSPHTALDSAPEGINTWLASGLGAGRSEPLLPPAAPAPDAHKVVVFAPAEHVSNLRGALSQAGAGQIGAYRECSFELAGSGTFLGEAAANPVVGERGRLERVAEIRLEMVCPKGALARVAEAVRRVHPYEEPAWDVYPLAGIPRPGFGSGRAVTLEEPVSLETLAARLKEHTGRPRLRVAPSAKHRSGAAIARVAVCAGSGGGVLARAPGFDAWITGELSHHAVLGAVAAGTSVLLAEHSSSERGYLPLFARRVAELADGALETLVSERDREPLEFW